MFTSKWIFETMNRHSFLEVDISLNACSPLDIFLGEGAIQVLSLQAPLALHIFTWLGCSQSGGNFGDQWLLHSSQSLGVEQREQHSPSAHSQEQAVSGLPTYRYSFRLTGDDLSPGGAMFSVGEIEWMLAHPSFYWENSHSSSRNVTPACSLRASVA